MSFNSSLFNPIQLCLEIDPAVQTQAWQQSLTFATATSQWNAYLNQLCLHTVLPWLQEHSDRRPSPFPSATSLPSLWEVVNGSAITADAGRFVLIPTEAIDTDEIRIPQEWVDIPDWVPDYYLAVQVNPDDAWIRINGFITHRSLKDNGQIDWDDRTYTLDDTDLIADINVLWVARQISPTEVTRSSVHPLPTLSTTQAQALLQRLGNPAMLQPRLEIPFEQWGALLSHGGWRQQLANARRGVAEQPSVWQWLQSGVSTLAQQAGWKRLEFQPGMAGARGEAATSSVMLVRTVTIAGQAYDLQISPVDRSDANSWRFELRRSPMGLIPAGVTLRLLTEDLQPFDGNEDRATTAVESLYIEVVLEPGEGLVWEVDPMPDGVDREILRF